MNIKNLALAIALSTSALSAFAAPVDDAGKDFYAQVNTGYAFGIKSSDNFGQTGKTFIAGLEAGAKINEHFRLGLGFDYLPKFAAKGNPEAGVTNLSDTKITSYAVMLNAFIDAGDFNGFRPYVVLGAGMAKNKTKNTTATFNGKNVTFAGASKTNFAYKAGLGTKYAVTDDFDVDVRYQFVDLGKFQTKPSNDTKGTSGKLRANVVLVGVAYKF